jgi:hypothetical protein
MSDLKKIKDQIDNLNNEDLMEIRSYVQKQFDILQMRIQHAENIETEKATLKIKDVYKFGGVGILLTLETITPGIVEEGYQYKYGESAIITIKGFENHFCESKFEHPHSNILAVVKLSVNLKFSELEINTELEPL